MKMTIARFGLMLAVTVTGAAALISSSPEVQHSLAVARGQDHAPQWDADHTSCLHTPDLAACTIAGAPDRIMVAIEQHMWQTYFQSHPEAGGVAYFSNPRWTPGLQGDPITLRWSVVPDGLFIPSGIGEPSGNSILRARLTQIFGSVDAGLQRFRTMYDRWHYLTGITYTEVSDDGAVWGSPGSTTRGDIRIGMHNFGSGTVLAYSGFPNQGDIVMNGSVDFNQPSSNFLFMRNVLAHENGHATGLLHSCPDDNTKLMEPNITLAYDGPQHDDIRGNQRNYGDRLEPNNLTGNAVDLGTQTVVDDNDLSIDDVADKDFFKFTVAQPNKMVTIRAIPSGHIYPLAPQNGDGSCPAGSDVSTINVLNLTLRLLDITTAILVDDDTSTIGFAETILNYHLPGPGTYYIRVATSSTTPSDIQLYDFQLRVNDIPPPSCPADLDGNHLVNGLDLAQLLGQWTGAVAYTPCPPYRTGDLNQDCKVNGLDLAPLLGAWGACP